MECKPKSIIKILLIAHSIFVIVQCKQSVTKHESIPSQSNSSISPIQWILTDGRHQEAKDIQQSLPITSPTSQVLNPESFFHLEIKATLDAHEIQSMQLLKRFEWKCQKHDVSYGSQKESKPITCNAPLLQNNKSTWMIQDSNITDAFSCNKNAFIEAYFYYTAILALKNGKIDTSQMEIHFNRPD